MLQPDAMATKEELVNLVKAIRNKYDTIKKADFKDSILLGKTFEPVTTSIDALKNNWIKEHTKGEDHIKQEPEDEEPEADIKQEPDDPPLTPVKTTELNYYLNHLDSPNRDRTYGIQTDKNGSLYIGNGKVMFDQSRIRVHDKSYRVTNGLLQLLFLKDPQEYTQNDLNIYKKILLLNDAHKNKTGLLKSNTKSKKFKTIISTLFQSGEGIAAGEEMMNTNQPRVEYYASADELVDRLRKLVASQLAGNTGVNNEIVSIISELRGLGLIY